jgi:hypothetical protein
MAAAKHCPWMTAATEHSPEVPLLQSTEMSANVVFINIDWKASRHLKTLNTNMKRLGKTIANVVQNMNPTMICMCEVGEATIPLTEEQMQQVSDQSMHAWKEAATEHFKGAATEHFELRSMFQVGAPYMTIYKDGAIQCSCHRILKDLYNAGDLPRTAQTFLCRGPGDVTVDVINVHAPSGKQKLTDKQRKTLLTNLLQSNSNSMPGEAIGRARFLIGGDMNTSPVSLSHLLQFCRQNGALHTHEHIHEPVFSEHGDICFLGGFKGNTLTTTAENHDPQHKPYGICWLMVQESATKQPWQDETRQQERSPQTKDGSATQQRAASSSGYATEQPLRRRWGPAADPAPEPAMPARFELENLESRAQQTELTDSDMEDFQRTGDVVKLEDFQRASDEETAAVPPAAATEHRQDPCTPQLASQEPSAAESVRKLEDFQRASDDETAAVPPAAATEHRQDPSTPQLASQELPADRGMIYSIVNEFLGKITFNSPEAEELLVAALKDESCLPPSMHLLLQEVFSPIFFHYPNGLKDRSVWEPRDTSKYIGEWYKLAAMRTLVTTDATATEHGEQLSKDQVSQIFKCYLQDMKTDPRPGQSNKKWAYYKSCAEAKMRREAGHTFVANAIWAIGLPRLPSFATERQDEQLSAQDLEAVPEAIHSVLNWLDRIASSLKQHQTTKEYQDALRKSGVAHGDSGLTATELETRTATRKAKFDMRTARQLDARWSAGWLTFRNCHRWQEKLLHAFWDGSLQRRLEELSSQGSADAMCRTPLHTLQAREHAAGIATPE